MVDINYGLDCATLCLAAYEKADDMPALMEPRGFDTQSFVVTNKFEETVVAARKADTMFVCFKGTVGNAGMMSNLNFAKVRGFADLPGGTHAGFTDTYDSLEAAFWPHINASPLHGLKKIVLCGHSRGGAFAQLCAVRADYMLDNRVQAVHVFGCPRVFSTTAAVDARYRLRDAEVVRWTINNDAVARLPYKWMGYDHIEDLHIYATATGKVRLNPRLGTKFWGQVSGRALGLLKLKALDGIRDHKMCGYLRLAAAVYERGLN